MRRARPLGQQRQPAPSPMRLARQTWRYAQTRRKVNVPGQKSPAVGVGNEQFISTVGSALAPLMASTPRPRLAPKRCLVRRCIVSAAAGVVFKPTRHASNTTRAGATPQSAATAEDD